MNTAGSSEPRIQEVRVTRDQIIAHLVDGRVISVPLAWSWRLSEATPARKPGPANLSAPILAARGGVGGFSGGGLAGEGQLDFHAAGVPAAQLRSACGY